jgi:hypothetical protein
MIFFLHIPKTAGTTFYDVVKQNHSNFLKPKMEENPIFYLNKNLEIKGSAIRLPGGYETAPQMLNTLLELQNLEKLANIDFIGGHVGFGVHEYFSQPVTYISFLRNPQERLVSDFKEHCKEGRYFYPMLKNQNFEFKAYVELLLKYNMDNILTRQLAGPYDFFLRERKPINEGLYITALANSRSIQFFEMDQFDGALKYFKKNWGWKKISYSIKNKSLQNNSGIDLDSKLISQVLYHDINVYKAIPRVKIDGESFLRSVFNTKKK